MEFSTLFKNEIIWIIHKPAMTHYDKCLAEGASANWEAAHRLDFETSGLLLHARKSHSLKCLEIFKKPGLLKKFYWAGASRPLEEKDCCGDLVTGYTASRYRSSKRTHFVRHLAQTKNYRSYQEVQHRITRLPEQKLPEELGFKSSHLYLIELITGARHQIRSFFKAMNAPLMGDPLYGDPSAGGKKLELHAWKLEFSKNLQQEYSLPEEVRTF